MPWLLQLPKLSRVARDSTPSVDPQPPCLPCEQDVYPHKNCSIYHRNTTTQHVQACRNTHSHLLTLACSKPYGRLTPSFYHSVSLALTFSRRSLPPQVLAYPASSLMVTANVCVFLWLKHVRATAADCGLSYHLFRAERQWWRAVAAQVCVHAALRTGVGGRDMLAGSQRT